MGVVGGSETDPFGSDEKRKTHVAILASAGNHVSHAICAAMESALSFCVRNCAGASCSVSVSARNACQPRGKGFRGSIAYRVPRPISETSPSHADLWVQSLWRNALGAKEIRNGVHGWSNVGSTGRSSEGS